MIRKLCQALFVVAALVLGAWLLLAWLDPARLPPALRPSTPTAPPFEPFETAWRDLLRQRRYDEALELVDDYLVRGGATGEHAARALEMRRTSRTFGATGPAHPDERPLAWRARRWLGQRSGSEWSGVAVGALAALLAAQVVRVRRRRRRAATADAPPEDPWAGVPLHLRDRPFVVHRSPHSGQGVRVSLLDLVGPVGALTLAVVILVALICVGVGLKTGRWFIGPPLLLVVLLTVAWLQPGADG